MNLQSAFQEQILKMDHSYNLLALNRKQEIEAIQKTVAIDNQFVCKSSQKRNGVPTGMLMTSSIMKALDFPIDVEDVGIHPQNSSVKKKSSFSIFDNRK